MRETHHLIAYEVEAQIAVQPCSASVLMKRTITNEEITMAALKGKAHAP